MWRKAKTTKEIIQFNIDALERKRQSPFAIIDLDDALLTPDVAEFQNEIIEINKAGFMTIDSQLASKFEISRFGSEDEDCGYKVIKDKAENEDFVSYCYQRAYCSGFLDKKLLFKLARISDLGYEILSYDYELDTKKSERLNLTYYDYANLAHYSTNFHSIDASAEIDLQFLHNAIHYKTLKTFVNEMCYIFIYDNTYASGKNIYKDIISYICN